MLRMVLRRAWSDTLQALGGVPLLFTLGFIPVVGLALHWATSGWAEMLGELHVWLIYGLAATGLVFLTLFVRYLASAPYRIEKEKRNNAELSLIEPQTRIKVLEARRPDLRIEFEYVVMGGVIEQRPGQQNLSVFARVSNVGSMPSVSKDWGMKVKINGQPIAFEFMTIANSVRFGMRSKSDALLEFKDSDLFYNMTQKTIEVGGMLRGFMPIITHENLRDASAIIEVTLVCRDVLNNVSQVTTVVPRDRSQAFIPGAKLILVN